MRRAWLLPLLLSTSLGCGQTSVPQPAQTGRSVAQGSQTPPGDSISWTWRSEAHGFEVTVPSDRWKETPNPNVLAKFDCPRPLLVASVIGIRPARSDAEYAAAVAAGVQAKESGASNVDEHSGTNRHGHQHWVYVGDVTGGAQPHVFGTSVTRIDGKAVLLMFEGPCPQPTEARRVEAARALRAQADLFLGSVR
jgi:hypothetical protein